MSKLALYRYFSDSGQLLYVGITNDPHRRMSQHEAKTWWSQVRGMTLDWYPDRASVLAAEKRAITVENPTHNVQHKPEVNTHGASTEEGEDAGEANVSMAAAARYSSEWKPDESSRVPWVPFNESVDRAIEAKYSYLEITRAAHHAGQLREMEIDPFLPIYPGHLQYDESLKLAKATSYLYRFVQAEVRKFIAMAKADEEMWGAHWHEIIVRAAEIADHHLEEEGRDPEVLKSFLGSMPYGELAVKQAHRTFNTHQGNFPVSGDSIEVLELAVSNVMGTPVPESRIMTNAH